MRVRDREMLVRYVALLGLSGRELARRARLSPAVVNHLLAGRRSTCSAPTAAALERALDAPPGLLFETVRRDRRRPSAARPRIEA